MANLAKVLKDKRDAEERQRRNNPITSVPAGGSSEVTVNLAGIKEDLTQAKADITVLEELEPLTGEVAPTTSTVGVIGQLYLETTTPKLYYCSAISGSIYTWTEVGGGSGASTFLDLTDTPNAYTGQGGKIVAVKADATALEFVSAPAAQNGIPVGGAANQLLAKNSATDYDVKWTNAPAAANGLPAGGAAGQILKKKGATDYDSEWGNPSPLTTKGDIHVFGSADNRLPVGTDGQILAADSSSALGVHWKNKSDVIGCTIYLSNVTLTAATGWRKVAFDTVLQDDATMDDIANNAIIAPSSGWYSVFAHVRLSAEASNWYMMSIYKNGSAALKGLQFNATSIDFFLSGVLYLAANDAITTYFYSGSSTSIKGDTAATNTLMSLVRLS